MKLIGLTGGVGMGKSTCAQFLEQRGLPVIDTDLLARQLVEPGQPALDQIVALFGSQILDESGHLNRAALAEQVFANPERRLQLEAVLHPQIRARWLAQADQWRAEGVPVAVVVIPLLFETGAQRHFDLTICVACLEETQKQRLLRRGWTEQQIAQRIQAQWPVKKKLKRAII